MLEGRPDAAPQLTCPAPAPLGQADSHLALQLFDALRRDARDVIPIGTVGLELKVSLLAIGGIPPTAEADNDFWLRKCRSLSLRPAIEPLLLGHWNKIKRFDLTDQEMARFVSMLSGSKLAARTGDSYGLWDAVRFERAEEARSWWPDIQAVARTPEFKSLLPFYCYARTIIAHPYPDGNGRLARAMLTSALAREADLPAPILPLAPAFYKNGAKVADAVRALSANGDWGKFARTVVDVLQDALSMSCHSVS